MMKKLIISLPVLLMLFTASSCEDEIINNIIDGFITAKEKLNEVKQEARNSFAADAELAAIYGRNVMQNGEVDLLETSNVSLFAYAMQSDNLQSNEIYVPVVDGTPVKSPVNFDDMLQFIKDSTAKDILSRAFGLLSEVSIDLAASFDDSPQVLTKMYDFPQAQVFTNEYEEKIDMLLLPSKSIDSTSVSNSADWIVNLYTDNQSLSLWLQSSSGEIQVLTGK